MPDNHFFNQPGYGQPQTGSWGPQQPMDQSPQPYNGAGNLPNYQPYPPPSADEKRLTAMLERIEHKLNTIFAMLQTNKP